MEKKVRKAAAERFKAIRCGSNLNLACGSNLACPQILSRVRPYDAGKSLNLNRIKRLTILLLALVLQACMSLLYSS